MADNGHGDWQGGDKSGSRHRTRMRSVAATSHESVTAAVLLLFAGTATIARAAISTVRANFFRPMLPAQC